MENVNYKRNKYVSKLSAVKDSNDIAKMKLYTQKLNYYNRVSQVGGGPFEGLATRIGELNTNMKQMTTGLLENTGAHIASHGDQLNVNKLHIESAMEKRADIVSDIVATTTSTYETIQQKKALNTEVEKSKDAVEKMIQNLKDHNDSITQSNGCYGALMTELTEQITDILDENKPNIVKFTLLTNNAGPECEDLRQIINDIIKQRGEGESKAGEGAAAGAAREAAGGAGGPAGVAPGVTPVGTVPAPGSSAETAAAARNIFDLSQPN